MVMLGTTIIGIVKIFTLNLDLREKFDFIIPVVSLFLITTVCFYKFVVN